MCNARVTLVHRAPLLSASSLNGLADTDSESAIFSSGLLALFYLRSLVHTRLFLPRAPPFRGDRSLSFPLPTPVFFLSQLPLPRILSQILTYDYVRADILNFGSRPVRANGKSLRHLQCCIINGFISFVQEFKELPYYKIYQILN